MPNHKYHSSQNPIGGFSLLEVLIAIVVMSFVMLAVSTTVNKSIETKEEVTLENQFFLSLDLGIAIMEKDLANLYSPLFYQSPANPGQVNDTGNSGDTFNPNSYQGNRRFLRLSEDGIPIPVFESPRNHDFLFFTKNNARKVENEKTSRFAWVHYQREEMDLSSLGPDDPRKGEKLFQIERAHITADIFSPLKEIKDYLHFPLLQYIKEFELHFWDQKEKKFLTDFNQIRGDKSTLYAVKIKVTQMDKLGGSRVIEKIVLNHFPPFNSSEKESQRAKAQ